MASMSSKLSHQPFSKRFDHLVSVIGGERFLRMRGLNNDLPFYVCEFRPSESLEMHRLHRQLVNTLEAQTVACLGGRGVKVLEVNLYDLCIELLSIREGSSPEISLWDELLAIENTLEKDELLEVLQNVLSVKEYLIPSIREKLERSDFDVLFLTGIGEVFPYIRSHNVLNNLQSTAKTKPTVMFFPGEYRYSLEQGASLELFGLLHDDKYYRAFNIYEVQA